MKRILIVKFWALGDILMATPVLRALRDLYPDAAIDWLVDIDCAGVLDNNPLIDKVIPFDSGSWRRNYRRLKITDYLRTSFSLREKLLSTGYDVVVFLHAEKWWVQWFNVAPVTIGLFPSQTAGGLKSFYTKSVVVPESGIGHSTDHYLRIVDALGGNGVYDRHMIYSPSEHDTAEARRFLAKSTSFDSTKKTVVMHPGSSQDAKCWPAEQFATLAVMLREYNVVITGSVKEIALAETIFGLTGKSGHITIASGMLVRLGQTGAVVRESVGVVTNDTSLLHIASALNVPVVGLFGATRPGINKPLYGKKSLLFDDSVECSPCYRGSCLWNGDDHLRCFKSVTPELAHSRLIGMIEASEGMSDETDFNR